MSASPQRSLVTVAVNDSVGHIRLCDPRHRNALSKRLSDDLATAVAVALDGGAGAIVLSAEPPVFCAGGSLEGMLNREVPLNEMYAGQQALITAPVPTIAAVTGAAIGAGVNLSLACDVVIAGESARFDPRFLDVGIHPGGGHLWRLVQQIGVQGAAALVLCGDVLTGAEVAAQGLAWRCVPDAEVEQLAVKLGRRASGRPRALTARTKQTLWATLTTTTFEDAFACELDAQEWSVTQPEFLEAVRRVRADLESRKMQRP